MVNTHLHFDHCGGNTMLDEGALRPAYPRARYFVQQGEWHAATHPNERTRHYHRWAGYRFYGATGALVVFGQLIYELFGGWNGLMGVWGLLFLVVVPWGLYDIWRAAREDWQDITIEVAIHE